jgi:hypothetical protein
MKTSLTLEEKLAAAESEIQRLTEVLYESNKALAELRPKYNKALDDQVRTSERLKVLEAKDATSEQRFADAVDSFTFIIFGLLKLSPGALPQMEGEGADNDQLMFESIQQFLGGLLTNDAAQEPSNQDTQQESA